MTRIVAIVQARMGSTRLPNKVMRPVAGVPMIELLLGRLARSQRIDQIGLATSEDPRNQPLADHVAVLGYPVSRGSEDDVLDRFYQAARALQADVVVRITGDCPLIDAALVDQVIERFLQGDADYVSNAVPASFPDGLDTEVFSMEALTRAWQEAPTAFDREHVTPYLRDSGHFRLATLSAPADYSAERWTVDEPTDFDVVAGVFEHFAPRTDFGWTEVLELRHHQPQLFAANQHLIRNEGASMGTGQKLWKRAKNVIAGGNMLLSKRPEMFLPEQWPAYFSRARGCTVWDLDDNAYTDMSIMGIGTNTLGYGHPEVDGALRRTIDACNMSTFNCP